MKVRIQGREDENGQRFADRIEFDEDLKGPARNIIQDIADTSIGTFTVLRQKVTVDVNTIFDDDVGDNNSDGNIDINDLELAVGQIVVEVSGHLSTDGILATRIDRLNTLGSGFDESEAEVKGVITDVSNLPVSFVLNNTITVNIDGAIFVNGLGSSADLLVNLFVEVKGNLVSDTEINADEVELEGRIRDEDRAGEFEVEGILQSINTTTTPHIIVINGITIPVVDASDLTSLVGKRIEIHGEFNADNILILRAGNDGVKTERENSVRTADILVSADTTTDTLTSRLGLQIIPTGLSRVKDKTREGNDNLYLDDFISGLQGKGSSSGVPVAVEARGFPDGESVTWTRVEIGEVKSDRGISCQLRGPVDSVDVTAFTFIIRGVVVNASGELGGSVSYQDEREIHNEHLTREQFFTRLSHGQIVQATGNKEKTIDTPDCSNLSLIADEVEFEGDDGVFGTVPDDEPNDDSPTADDELIGAVSNVNNESLTFVVATTEIKVTADTIIDSSIIEAVRGVEIENDEELGNLPESLGVLLDGQVVVVRVIVDGDLLIALSIEDI
jgi:hypothetical protein